MMSPATIAAMSRKAVRDSRAAGKLPLVIEEEDLAPGVLEQHLRHIPFLGDRNPKGFTPLRDEDGFITEHFVDSSGFGSPGEPAETWDRFCGAVRERGANHAYSISQAGQFQVYIRVFRVGKGRA